MIKITADDKIPFLMGALEPFARLSYLPGADISPEDLKDADAVITRTRTKCNEGLLAGSNVKFIATATIGYDHIDTEYCSANGIKWTNAPGCNSSSVAQYITSALLTLAERHGIELRGKTLGVIGVGNVGKKVAVVGKALGLNVLLNDPPRARTEGSGQFTALPELLAKSDFVTVHVPLNREGADKTLEMCSGDFFKQMKDSAFFINSSRGKVVVGEDLKEALKGKTIKGAVLDVWPGEPDIDRELLSALDIATPHIAGYSLDGKANGTAMSVNAVSEFFGFPLKNWYPENVTEPEKTCIEAVDGEFKLIDAVRVSYNILDDDGRLRKSPETFEKQRGDYPLRREFHIYTVKGLQDPVLLESLKLLGFKSS